MREELIKDEKEESKVRKLEQQRMSESAVIVHETSHGYPSLHLVLPALERLYKRLTVPEYAPFAAAIQGSLAAIEQHYSRTEFSDAYIICTVLDPTQKMTWFDREWDEPAREKAWTLVRNKFM